jgi:N-methylhydantoinase A
MSFGGAGGLHVCALAEALGMTKAMAPIHAGVLSALGMVVAPPGRQLSQTLAERLDRLEPERVVKILNELKAHGTEALQNEGVAGGDIEMAASLDLRYLGQSFTLTLPWRGELASVGPEFHAAHRARYGHALDQPVELVNVRVGLTGPPPAIELPKLPRGREAAPPAAMTAVWGIDGNVPVWERQRLVANQQLPGPAIITEAVATSFVEPGWRCELDAWGNLLLSNA